MRRSLRSGTASHAQHRISDAITRVDPGPDATCLPLSGSPNPAGQLAFVNTPGKRQVASPQPPRGVIHSPSTDQGSQHSTHTAPFHVLLTLLSRTDSDFTHGQKYEVDVLLSLIASVKADGCLGLLNDQQLSSLISLLGTLSILPAHSFTYSNPLALYVNKSTSDTYWTLIAQIANTKFSRSAMLTGSDHYWLMRMELATAVRTDHSNASDRMSDVFNIFSMH